MERKLSFLPGEVWQLLPEVSRGHIVCVAAQFTRWVKVPLNFRLGSSYPNLGVTSQGLMHKLYQRAGRLP